MRAGLLRHRLVIQQADAVQKNTYGEPQSPTWTTIATVWGEVKPLMGKERFTAQQVQADVTHQITLRSRAVSPSNRILFGARVFGILEVLRPSEREISLTLMAREEVA